MSKVIPTIGDTVIYYADGQDIKILQDLQKEKGIVTNVPAVGQAMPATVVEAWGPDTLNLKVIVDGDAPDIWRTSVQHINQIGAEGVLPSMCWEWEWQAQQAGRL